MIDGTPQRFSMYACQSAPEIEKNLVDRRMVEFEPAPDQMRASIARTGRAAKPKLEARRQYDRETGVLIPTARYQKQSGITWRAISLGCGGGLHIQSWLGERETRPGV